MAEKTPAKLIGLFVLGGIALFTAALLLLGSGKLFTKTRQFVLYFSSSVQGLDRGAPVLLKGVQTGQVDSVRLLLDVETGRLINEVVITNFEGSIGFADGYERMFNTEEEELKLLNTMIDRGLRAQLQMQSFITGKLLVAFNFINDPAPPQFYNFHSKYIELPTAESGIEALTRKFEDLPWAQIVENIHEITESIKGFTSDPRLNRTLTNLDRGLADFPGIMQSAENLISKPEIGSAIDQLDGAAKDVRGLIGDARGLIGHVDGKVDPLVETIQATKARLLGTLEEAQRTLESVRQNIGQDSRLKYSITITLQEISGAARAVRELADMLNTQPEALIQGKAQPQGGR